MAIPSKKRAKLDGPARPVNMDAISPSWPLPPSNVDDWGLVSWTDRDGE